MLDRLLVWTEIHGPFWLTVILGGVVRIAMSKAQLSIWQMAGTMATAMFAAWVMTEPTMKYFEMEADDYTVITAAFWTLAGEGVARSIVRMSNEVDWVKTAINRLLGKGG